MYQAKLELKYLICRQVFQFEFGLIHLCCGSIILSLIQCNSFLNVLFRNKIYICHTLQISPCDRETLNHSTYVCGQFHHRGHFIQTQFSNFNLKQTEYKGELSSFPFMNMFVPTDMLTWLYSFANWLISIIDIEWKSTVADVRGLCMNCSKYMQFSGCVT